MMDYNKINKLFKMTSFSKMEFYKEIGLTATGFRQMMEKQSLKVDTLEKIAAFFKVPVTSFFTDERIPVLNEPAETYGNNEMIEVLKQVIALKDDVIKLQKELATAKESQSIQPKKSMAKLERK